MVSFFFSVPLVRIERSSSSQEETRRYALIRADITVLSNETVSDIEVCLQFTNSVFTQEFEGGVTRHLLAVYIAMVLEPVLVIEIDCSKAALLGNMAFRNAVSLKSVMFSKGLKSIGNATFQNCVSLESVELHENIESLGNSTFSDCKGLKSLHILGDLTSIGFSTFYDCRALESVYFASKISGNVGNKNYIFFIN